MRSAASIQDPAKTPRDDEDPGFFRTARALIGWIPPDQAHQLLLNGMTGTARTPDVEARTRSARDLAAARPFSEQTGVVMAPPTGIGDYLAVFRQNASNLFDEGFKICTVSLPKLYALQPATFTDHWVENVAALDERDVRGIAAVTLPTETEAPISVAQNAAQKTITLTSPNLNLQVVAGKVEQSPAGLVNLQTTCANSVLQVAHFRDRYFCRDGHTRALQLLKRGITTVPAVIKEFGATASWHRRRTCFRNQSRVARILPRSPISSTIRSRLRCVYP